MGKIRVKTFDESQEDKDKKLEAKREAKRAEKAAKKSEEKTDDTAVEEAAAEVKVETKEEKDGKKAKKAKFAKAKQKSKRHVANSGMVDRKTAYPLTEAIKKLKGFQKSKFDETVELHINVKEKGVSGQVVLPHGTGKKRKIQLADDATIAAIEGGKIDFDVLIATPQMMPKLAKVAKVLGPRGLMPNPKNGTITNNPDEAIKKLEGGQVNYKTEPQFPLIHMSIGKASFEDKQIMENVNAILASVGANKIQAVTLKSTMSPGIKVAIA